MIYHMIDKIISNKKQQHQSKFSSFVFGRYANDDAEDNIAVEAAPKNATNTLGLGGYACTHKYWHVEIIGLMGVDTFTVLGSWEICVIPLINDCLHIRD